MSEESEKSSEGVNAMRVMAAVYSLLCLATMGWLILCKVFQNTYFRPVAKAIENWKSPYGLTVECGGRMMDDIFFPSMFTLAVSLVLSVSAMIRNSPQTK